MIDSHVWVDGGSTEVTTRAVAWMAVFADIPIDTVEPSIRSPNLGLIN
jgi:hypothetical protein